MPLHYDISERIKTEPAQLWAAKHLFSVKKERFHLSTCHTVFCIYFGSLSSELWFDLTSLSDILQAHRLIGQSCKLLQDGVKEGWALCSTASLLRARQQETHSWWADLEWQQSALATGRTNTFASFLQGFLLTTKLLITAGWIKQQEASPLHADVQDA